MTTIDQTMARGQEALRASVLTALTGSANEEALLKEHYDSLHDLTNISKKTLKRFFREKVQVGPQTRNLLAAIALGKKEELNGMSDQQQDYYLTFLESLDSTAPTPHYHNDQGASVAHFAGTMAQCYKSSISDSTYIPLNCWRRRIQRESISSPPPREISLEETLLFNHNSGLLIGGPGMGKTTFARHLCYEWAQRETWEDYIPIYIDLKNPAFNRHKHGITSYILGCYFREEHDWAVLDFLENNSHRYYLLLDGFDDLTGKEKETLWREMESLSVHSRYVVFSRDYGFNDFDLPNRNIYEIAGLDMQAQEQYIRHLISGEQRQLKMTSLMAYLHGHPVLSSLSRTPSALSQIVALTSHQPPFELLERIKSDVDLQLIFNKYRLGKF